MLSEPRTNVPVISVEGLGKSYRLYERPHERLLQMLSRGRHEYGTVLNVLDGVTFDVLPGETVGVIGRNGAGKSTLLRILAGTLTPSVGRALVRGRVAPLIELGSGFNPELTGEENVIFNGTLLGMTEAEVMEKFDRIAAFADIGDYLYRPVKIYSSGMFARLAFSVAIHVDPDVLIVDEILSVGDSAFQRKCVRRFHEVREGGCTILLVAHDEYLVRTLCAKALYLRDGQMIAFGNPRDVVDRYVHDTMPSSNPVSPPTFSVEIDNTTIDDIFLAEAALTSEISGQASSDDAANSAIRLYGFELEDHAGQSVQVAPHGSTLFLRFAFEVLQPKEVPSSITFVFNLYSIDGVYVCGATTLMDAVGAFPAGPAGEVEVTFHDIPLLTGAYFWRVAVNDAQGLLVLSEKKGICPFRVTSSDYRSAGLVHLSRSWNVRISDVVSGKH